MIINMTVTIYTHLFFTNIVYDVESIIDIMCATQEEFENTKGVIRIRKSNKNRHILF